VNVLGIETSGTIGSVAVCRDTEILAEDILEEGMAHGRMLVPLLDRVVQSAGWDKRRDIDLIAVSRGPGSFTGLRVGLTCAKTLADAVGKPIIGVCSFDAMAQNAPDETAHVLVATDAKRNEVYAAAYVREAGEWVRKHDPQTMTPETAAALLSGEVFILGDAATKYAKTFSAPCFRAAPEDLWRIRASVVARLGLFAYSNGRRDDALSLEPIYLRRPEAEERRLARERSSS